MGAVGHGHDPAIGQAIAQEGGRRVSIAISARCATWSLTAMGRAFETMGEDPF